MLKIQDFDFEDVGSCRIYLEYYLQELGKLELSPKAISQLKQFLNRDDITNIKEYKELLDKILKNQHLSNLSWKLHQSFLENIENIGLYPLLYIGIFSVIFIYILARLNYLKKIKKFIWFVYKMNETLLRNIIAASTYLLPVLTIARTGGFFAIREFPPLQLIFTPLVMELAEILDQSDDYTMIYFFVFYIICIRNHLPKPRFIRFHLMYCMILDQFVQVFSAAYIPYMNYLEKNGLDNEMFSVGFFVVLFSLSFVIPAVFLALTGRYIPNTFMRETIELHLGRDNDPDFKWWDREK